MANGEKVELLSVAIDMQGAEVVRPYLEKASTTFVTVVDTENMFSREFGFKKIPNGYFLEPDLSVSYSKTWGFDIRSSEIRNNTAYSSPLNFGGHQGGRPTLTDRQI